MSLVHFALTHDFILVGGDTRGCDINQKVVSNTFNKVIQINRNIIIGCSGNAQDSYTFLEKYCNFSRESGLSCKENDYPITFLDIISELNFRYKELLKMHLNRENTTFFNFTAIVCGHNGNDFVAMQYSLNEDIVNKPNGAYPIEINPLTGTRCFVIGTDKYLPMHNINYSKELKKSQPTTIQNYRNVMQKVFNIGAKFDKTINNLAIYKKIELKDVL